MYNSCFKEIKSVCCQGTTGAYSHIAAAKIFPSLTPKFVKTFSDVFTSVKNKECDAGILPLENSTAGLVGGIIELLIKNDLEIIYSATLDISHTLCAKRGTRLLDINKIYSHQQALLQCSNFLGTLKIEQTETANTAVSARLAAENENTAAVCSKEAAKIFGLEILKEDICNNKKNQTKFIVIADCETISENASVTSLFFKIKNKSGSLYEALGVFTEYNVNMSSLHSIPLEEEIWNYGFYADLEGNVNNPRIKECLAKLKEKLLSVKILGSYSNNQHYA